METNKAPEDDFAKDLVKEMTEATAEGENSQEDYETHMKNSAAKRAEDSKTITDKVEAGLKGVKMACDALRLWGCTRIR